MAEFLLENENAQYTDGSSAKRERPAGFARDRQETPVANTRQNPKP